MWKSSLKKSASMRSKFFGPRIVLKNNILTLNVAQHFSRCRQKYRGMKLLCPVKLAELRRTSPPWQIHDGATYNGNKVPLCMKEQYAEPVGSENHASCFTNCTFHLQYPTSDFFVCAPTNTPNLNSERSSGRTEESYS